MTDGSANSRGWMPKIVKESGISLSGSVVGTGLNYVLLVTLTRFLDPSEFGTFAIAQSIIAVAMVFVLCGTPRALDRFIPHYITERRAGKIRGLVLGVVRVSSVFGAAVCVLLLLLSRRLSITTFNDLNLLPILRLMVAAVPPLALLEIVATSFAGFRELRYRVYTHQLMLPILKIALAFWVLSLGWGLTGWIWAYLVSVYLTAGFAWWLLRSRVWHTMRDVPPEPVDIRGVISYSWPLSLNSLLLMMSGQVGVLLLGVFRPEADVGVYRVYVYLVLLLALVRTSFMQIYKPMLAGLIHSEDTTGAIELHRRVSKWMLIAGAFFGLALLLMGGDLLRVLVPESYRVSVSALLILAAARTVVACLGPQGMTLEAFGNTRLSMVNALLIFGVNLSLGRLLIPSHGVVGAAIALAAALLVAAIAELVEVYSLHRLHPFSGAYVRALLVAVGAGAVVYSMEMVWQTPGIERLIVLTVSLALLFAIGLRVSGSLDKEDHAVIVAIRDRLRRR